MQAFYTIASGVVGTLMGSLTTALLTARQARLEREREDTREWRRHIEDRIDRNDRRRR